MEATLKFNLPEEESELKVALQGRDMVCLICDVARQLRSWRKYGHPFKSADEAVTQIEAEFHKIVASYPHVDIDA